MNTENAAPAVKRLGETNTWLSPVGLGTWQFSQGRGLTGKFWPTLPAALIMSIVEEALNHGIDWFDTAEVYGGGRSEHMLAAALDELNIGSDRVAIATKWWPLLRTASHLEHSVSARIKALHGRPITLYQIHQPFSPSSIEAQMQAMARLLDQGLIRHAGVSNFSTRQLIKAYQALKAHGHVLVSNQVRYHLLDRRIESNGLLACAEDLGISLIAYSPLAQGLLTGRFHQTDHPAGIRRVTPSFRPEFLKKTRPLIEAMREMSVRYQVSPSQVALNWIITRPGASIFAIPGATRVSQAAQNAGAMGWALSASDRQALDHLSAQVMV